MQLYHEHSLRTAQLREPVENGCTDIHLVDLDFGDEHVALQAALPAANRTEGRSWPLQPRQNAKGTPPFPWLGVAPSQKILDGQTKLGATPENFGLRPHFPLGAANHYMRLLRQMVNEPRDFKAAL